MIYNHCPIILVASFTVLAVLGSASAVPTYSTDWTSVTPGTLSSVSEAVTLPDPDNILALIGSVPDKGNWHGFTMGVVGTPTEIPSPGAIFLGALGVFLVGVAGRRRLL